MKIEIDVVVTSHNGCEYHVTGWVDINVFGGVQGYDIQMEGLCGDHHFTGGADLPNPDENGNGSLSDNEIKNFANSLL